VIASHGAAGVRTVILDIEGTTTPIAFVTRVLFPYARQHVKRHIVAHATEPEYVAIIERLRHQRDADARTEPGVPSWLETPGEARSASIVAYVEWAMDRDRKSTGLKALQGKIWEAGYRRGELVGEVFADVVSALERWHQAEKAVGIFSSGSVLAQQLLFRHSSAGDLTRFLRWHFDTTLGAKTDPDSYRRIANAVATPPASILFVSDVPRELDAARTGGLQTVLSIRPGNAPVPDGHGHRVIRTFDELAPETSSPAG
jgi:enolase-phosphatase E1